MLIGIIALLITSLFTKKPISLSLFLSWTTNEDWWTAWFSFCLHRWRLLNSKKWLGFTSNNLGPQRHDSGGFGFDGGKRVMTVSVSSLEFLLLWWWRHRGQICESLRRRWLSLSLSLVNWFWRCWVKNKELKKKRKLNGIEKDYREANVKCIWIGNQKVTCLFKFGLKFKKTNFECSNTTFETF
jgi:hypothetical protein